MECVGGFDLGVLEMMVICSGDVWLLNGFKWFVFNCVGEVFVVLVKFEGVFDLI